MRMEEKKRRMNIILGIILQIYFLFTWMNKRENGRILLCM